MGYQAFLTAERDPMRGRVFSGKYRVLERIGQGGMGTVYRAVQAGLNRPVALKILKREHTFDPDTVARFHREANALSLLTHPNTVRVYDFGQSEDGLLFLVMELLEGEVITEKLSREGPLDVLEAIRVTQEILRSLAEAHQHNIVHRDLKPDNIFLARLTGHREPVVKVLDFGIAKIAAPDRPLNQFETQAGAVFGTPRYMSPEQAQGAALDGRSDLYSVGTLLYLMLTGRAPFVDEDAVVVMAKHIREQPENPRTLAPERPIPKSLDDVVMRSLAKEPSERFQDAFEFEEALARCVPEAIAARRSSRFRLLPRTAWVVAAAAVVGALGYGGYRALASPARGALVSSPLATSDGAPAPIHPVPVVTQYAPSDLDHAIEQGPGPANVAIRSDPAGATVFREGKRLGETPLYLLVQPDQDLVRVELRKPGFQPLAAELTARDGVRLLKLSPAPPQPRATVERPARPRAAAPAKRRDEPAEAPAEATAPAPPPEPAQPQPQPEPEPKTPYERFE